MRMKHCLLCSVLALCSSMVGCGEDKDSCVAELLEPCPTTMNIRYVCGCDGETYVNASMAECHQIYSYTEGECE